MGKVKREIRDFATSRREIDLLNKISGFVNFAALYFHLGLKNRCLIKSSERDFFNIYTHLQYICGTDFLKLGLITMCSNSGTRLY